MDYKTLELIIEAHDLGMTQKEAAEFTGVKRGTIQYQWKKHDLESNHESAPRRITAETTELVFEAHEHEMSLKEAAKYAGVSQSTVRSYWDKKGLKPHHTFGGKKTIKKEKIELAIEAYERGMNTTEAGDYAGLHRHTVSKVWKANGLAPKPRGRIQSNENIITKIAESRARGMSTREAAEHTGVSYQTIINYWNKKGLKPHYSPFGKT
ncbi:helix-turn-helix domain-containing protein [Candidatus Woesearchaeota archaeon]|nr:helix-turn-helix domain-containing protein [Candidatus Woesearchaeota archaeon]